MAAVAAEPGAAAASTTEEELEFALESADHERNLNADVTRGSAPVMDLCHQHRDVDAVQECSPVQMEIVGRPDIEAAGKTLSAHGGDEHDKMCYLNREGDNIADNNFEDYKMNDNLMSTGYKEQCSLNLEAVNEVSPHDTHACLLPSSISVSVSQPSVVFLHSLPAHPSVTETGLSLAEPAEPAIVGRNLGSIDDFRELIKPSSETDPVPESACDGPGSEFMPREDALLECPQHADHPQSLSVSESDSNLGASVDDGFASDFSAVPAEHSPQLPVVGDTVLSSPLPVDSCSPQRRFDSDLCEVKPEPKPSLPISESTGSPLELLIPGSEVRVCLDHIIDDALVVSFRLGEKLFSGVLMDLSKRFGPYGIPITLHPKREYKDKPEPMQLKAVPPTADAEKTHGKNTNDNSQKEPPPPTAEGRNGTLESTPTPTPPEANPNPNRPPHPWTSKPPPLFQEGAPYPPPLFIRDTYNQPLPQPPPRKIKRPKRRLLYREEPTSIMNAIKLRPRQVLCDKCKGTVTVGGGSGGGDSRRETRRGGPAASDCRNDDGKRRRNDHSANTVSGKRHRPDEKARGGADSAKRQSSAHLRISSNTTSSSVGSVKGAAAGGNRVVRGVSSSAGNGNSRVSSNQLSSAKKVLQSKNVDHVAKAQEKMAKVPCRQRDTVTSSGVNNTNSNNNNNNSGGGAKTMTRSAALQQAHQHQKVHFTRRLQQISTRGVGGSVGVGSSGVGGPPSISSPLPPRMRLKPQRYRNEENESSPPSSSKPSPPPPPPLTPPPPCLEKVPTTSVVHVSLAKVAAAAPPPHCTSSSRSSSSASSTTSSSCSPPSSGSACEPAAVVAATVAAPASVAAPAFTATAAATVFETLGPAKVTGPEPDPRPPVLPEPQTQPILKPHPQPQPEPELVPEPATVTATAAERGDSTVEAEEQEGREERLEMRGSGNKTAAAASGGGNLLVYVSLKPSQPDSSSTSMCSVDSSDEAKSSNSECSSTETFDFPPPGALSSPVPVVPAIPVVPSPSTSSSSSSTVATSATTTADAVIAPDTSSPVIDGDENRRGKSHKGSTFSKNVSKCMTLDGRTICVGDIVWAKIYGFPWWPARIQAIQVSRKDNGLLVRQEARVAWFGSPTTSCLGLTQLAPFLENFQSRFNKKRKGLYRKAITEAAKAAKQLTPEVRALLTQFET
ncbi:PWWP domain-containing protein 2A isoform X2 [Engraulis encrasicolus]|uniref:PWWP domain-containing protein 2A isoform X2 n=1 Tax=Engraulis encrasicolus TaxID=184585 RepID=UPI002FD38777